MMSLMRNLHRKLHLHLQAQQMAQRRTSSVLGGNLPNLPRFSLSVQHELCECL